MAKTSANLGMTIPESTDKALISVISAALEIIDEYAGTETAARVQDKADLQEAIEAIEGGGGTGTGDMLASVYDPNEVNGDAFDMDNMVQGDTNKFVTASEKTVIGNTSGTNTGDETATTIKTKLGISTLSGSNTGDQVIPDQLSDLLDDSAHRLVTDTEKSTWNAKLDASQKGAASGVAELDSSGKVPTSQLPAYVDDVIEVTNYASLPATGETGKIYVALDTNLTYRWSGSAYVEISASLALGETSSSAYRGDRGKAAYDHSQSTHAPSDTQSQLDAKLPLAGGTMTGVLVAQNNTSYTTKQARNITLSTSAASGGGNGDVWFKRPS